MKGLCPTWDLAERECGRHGLAQDVPHDGNCGMHCVHLASGRGCDVDSLNGGRIELAFFLNHKFDIFRDAFLALEGVEVPRFSAYGGLPCITVGSDSD